MDSIISTHCSAQKLQRCRCCNEHGNLAHCMDTFIIKEVVEPHCMVIITLQVGGHGYNACTPGRIVHKRSYTTNHLSCYIIGIVEKAQETSSDSEHCVFVPLLYFMNSGCVLEFRETPTSQVTI